MQAEETIYTVKEIATHWKLSTDKIQQLFLDAYHAGETGIMALRGPSGRWKTVRFTLRITESAKRRMFLRLQGHAV